MFFKIITLPLSTSVVFYIGNVYSFFMKSYLRKSFGSFQKTFDFTSDRDPPTPSF